MPKVKPSLSLCMIVRNEEKLVGQCLASVKDFVNEIIVVDTGSQDRTPEIARRFGAKIFAYPWTNDFSDSRNYSIRCATGDWILVLDADEKLAQKDAVQLPSLVQNGNCLGFKLIQRTYLWDSRFAYCKPTPGDYEEGRGYCNCVDVSVIRLFRRTSDIKYQGRIHELVDPVFDAKRLPYCNSNLVIHHFGKVGDPQRLEDKKHLYLDLGRRKVSEEASNAMAHYELGIQLFELGEYLESLTHFESAFQLNPKIDFALLFLALAHHRLGNMREAGSYYRKCLETNPTNDRVLFDYANFERDKGHLRTALRLYQRCLNVNPKNALALFNQGLVHEQIGRSDEAFSCMNRALALNPDSEQLVENFARHALKSGHLEEAAEHLLTCVRKFPSNPRFPALLAQVYFKLRRFAESLDWATRALKMESENNLIRLIQAHTQFILGGLSQAQVNYKMILDRDPSNLDCMMNLVLISELRSDPKETRIWLERLLFHHPNHSLAMKKYGLLLSQNQMDLESTPWLEKAIRANPQDTQCLLALGSTYERNERYEDAIHLYQKAGEDQPRLRRVTDTKIERLRGLMESKNGGLIPDTSQASIEPLR